MKKFDHAEEQRLNQLAVDYVSGNYVAGEEFMEIVAPKLKRYASKLKNTYYSELEADDLTQEFLLVAYKCCGKFVEKYNDGKNNIMGLIYKACKNRFLDIGRTDSAEMRASRIQVGVDEYGEPIFETRITSLNTNINETESTLEEIIPNNQPTVEQILEKQSNRTVVKKVVEEFVYNTKGRNALIVPLIYKSMVEDWNTEELNSKIAEVLMNETGKEPTYDAVRKAKSRALKELRKSIESGKLTVANQLEWEF